MNPFNDPSHKKDEQNQDDHPDDLGAASLSTETESDQSSSPSDPLKSSSYIKLRRTPELTNTSARSSSANSSKSQLWYELKSSPGLTNVQTSNADSTPKASSPSEIEEGPTQFISCQEAKPIHVNRSWRDLRNSSSDSSPVKNISPKKDSDEEHKN